MLTRDRGNILDWSGDEVVEWTKPRWYERLTVLIILISIGILFAIPPTPLRIVFAVAFVLTWYFFLMFVIEDIKTRIIAWRIKRAAERRYHRRYALQNLFRKYPWLETYLREVRRAEELGFPYVPDMIVRDPATAKIEIRRPPTRWILPQQIQYQLPQQVETPRQPLEQLAPQPPAEQISQSGEEELPSDLQLVFESIKQLVGELSVEETHALFRIMAELKGYGLLPKEYVAMQFVNLPLQTLTKYLERGYMPTTPKRVRGMKERVILPTLRRDLEASTIILVDALTRLAERYPRYRERVDEILRSLMEPREEEQSQETLEDREAY